MSSSDKRKHINLSLRDKWDILKKLDKGVSMSSISKEYGVGRSTVYDIRKNSEKIEDFIKNSEAGSSLRFTLKHGVCPEMEDSLFEWYLQEREQHIPLSGEMLKEKARFLYKRITGKEDFKASDGWLDRFKSRFGITSLATTDSSAVELFQENFLSIVHNLGLSPEQIYIADESGLFWRSLPNKIFFHSVEKSTPDKKLSRDRLTFMPCANASGSHKLDLLVVGKEKKPGELKNLPVIYKNQCQGWVTKEIFSDWFFNDFTPAVKLFLMKNKLPLRAMLLLDTGPGHPPESQLKTDDCLIVILCLPPNCTPLLQPMNQNIIKSLKIKYKRSLLYSVISQDEKIANSQKGTNIKDVIYNLAAAWHRLPQSSIISSWSKLWPHHPLLSTLESLADDTKDMESLNIAMTKVYENPNAEDPQEDFKNWMTENYEENEPILTDDKIICELGSEMESDASVTPLTVKHGDAVASLNKIILWAEENCVNSDEILTLRNLREKAVELALMTKK